MRCFRRDRVVCFFLFTAILLPVNGTVRDESDADPNESGVRILFPADRSALESGSFDLLCVVSNSSNTSAPALELSVDGKQHMWEPLAPPIFLVRLTLGPGKHEIIVGQQKLRVLVLAEPESSDVPEGWALYRHHRRSDDDGKRSCSICHKAAEREQGLTVGDPQEPSACLQCHPASDFEAIHFHPLDPIASCHTCHAVHGSSRRSLLKAPVKKLCAECHE